MSTPARSIFDPAPRSRAARASSFGAAMMIVAGSCQVLAGVVAVVDGDSFLTRPSTYAFALDATEWGWLHIVVGAIAVVTGVAVLGGSLIARTAGIAVACLSTVTYFLFLPYYPLWSLLVIAMNLVIIWGLASTSLAEPDG
jgi:hypothetical protein